MSLDGIVVRAIAAQLSDCEGGRINKIYQPSPHDIVLQIRARSGNQRLLLSANPTYPRVHLTEEVFHNPPEPPMFCMLLRKHCEGAVIERITQVGMERVLHIDVRHRDELGDLTIRRIIVELMGRHSNIILVDPSAGTILDGIHHVTPAISSYRIVMPGSSYTPPPEQRKLDPLSVGEAEFLEAWKANQSVDALPLERWLVQQFSGISPLAAKEIVHRGRALSVPEEAKQIYTAFHRMAASIRSGSFTPTKVDDEKAGKSYFSAIELTHLTGKATYYPTISECLEAYYADKAERDTVKQRTADLSRFLHNETAKNEKKIEKLQETLEEAREADRFRMIGELLTASLHQIQRGDKFVDVLNYYEEDPSTMRIPLDPLLTPAENAQRYFKKYTKLKNSKEIVIEQMESTKTEITYLQTVLTQLANAGVSDIDEIREELTEQGYLKERQKKSTKKKKTERPKLTSYVSSEGIPIYVGKNNLQNEYLTNRFASPSDTWLHTKEIPGSHVVIRGTDFGEPTLHEAAEIAAYYSQARASSRVPVDYTLIRHVHKPNGAKPGFVIYVQQRTLYVTPNEERMKGMISR
jgi:predicted ribosome quality control (RQC) complex YloA/Tae2 family protein